MNKYISKYSHPDTHFKRTDPFKYAEFDSYKETTLEKVVLAVTMVAFFVLLYILLSGWSPWAS